MNGNEQAWKGSATRIAEGSENLRESLFKRILRKIFPDQRKQERVPAPPLLGYLGTMHASRPFEVGDVSLGGFSLVTAERWQPGTEMPITLRRTNVSETEGEDRFTVQATVVRWTNEGVAFSVVLSEEESNAACGNPLDVRWADVHEMRLFLERLKGPVQIKSSVAGSGSMQGAFNRPARL